MITINNTNMITINNTTITKSELIQMMKESIDKVDRKGYRPGHRVEDIYGYFWEALEQKVNGKVDYKYVYQAEALIDADKLIYSVH